VDVHVAAIVVPLIRHVIPVEVGGRDCMLSRLPKAINYNNNERRK